MERSFAILPGDGIGVDVTREAVKVLESTADLLGFRLRLESFDYGADRYLKGIPGIARRAEGHVLRGLPWGQILAEDLHQRIDGPRRQSFARLVAHFDSACRARRSLDQQDAVVPKHAMPVHGEMHLDLGAVRRGHKRR